jgi:hypothetical protein
MIYHDTYTIEGQKFEVVDQITDNWDSYDWHEAAILRGPDGKLYWYEDSGCSCSYFGMDLNEISDLTPIKNWQEAVDLAKDSFDEADVFEFANRLRNG